MKSRDVIKKLEKAGFIQIRVSGSHHHFKKEGHPHLVTVPHPKRDMAIKTVRSIEKQSGVKMQK